MKSTAPQSPRKPAAKQSTAEQLRHYQGPAILSYGFRPLFLAAGIWAALAMPLWIAAFTGAIQLPSAFPPFEWHVHELLYGFLPAVVAGFLLTAVPNWTGRLPMTGTPLLVLVLLWLAGRVAVFLSAGLSPWIVAAIDLSFLGFLIFVMGREIMAGRNWRNLKVLVAVGLLFLGNLIFHFEAAAGPAFSGYGARVGIAAAIFLIMLIGGRIVPSFTRNWLMRRDDNGRMPAPIGRFDMAALLVAGIALLSWIFWPDGVVTAALAVVAACVHFGRLGRWAGERTMGESLVLVLHVGYFFVPLGFALLASSILWPELLLPSAALHAWTAGGIGVMTLAVMSRASLGHGGRPLQATAGISLIYVLIIVAAFTRVAAGLGFAYTPMLHLSSALWTAAFVLFAFIFAPILALPRR